MSRLVKFAVIGAGASITAFTLWNYWEEYHRPPGSPTTVNPADTHYAPIGQVLTNTAGAPLVWGIGIAAGLVAAEVLK